MHLVRVDETLVPEMETDVRVRLVYGNYTVRVSVVRTF